MSWILFHPNRVQPLYRQEGGPEMVGAPRDGTLREFTVALESIRRQVQADIVEIRTLNEAVAVLRQSDALALPRLQILETQMDNLPARVADLEKYGSPNAQKLQETVNRHEARIKDLEDAPQEDAARLKKRQDWMMVYTALGGCLFMVVSAVLTALGMLFTYLLAKGVI